MVIESRLILIGCRNCPVIGGECGWTHIAPEITKDQEQYDNRDHSASLEARAGKFILASAGN